VDAGKRAECGVEGFLMLGERDERGQEIVFVGEDQVRVAIFWWAWTGSSGWC